MTAAERAMRNGDEVDRIEAVDSVAPAGIKKIDGGLRRPGQGWRAEGDRHPT